MKAKKCDRCGEFYPVDKDSHVKLQKISYAANTRYTKGVDLCDRCQLELIDWLDRYNKS